LETVRMAKGGRPVEVLAILSPIRDSLGEIQGVSALYRDIGDLKTAEREKEAMEVQLRHAQKMKAIGQLAAGIAHEINTPTQYIIDNTRFLRDAFQDLEGLLKARQELAALAQENEATRDAANDLLRLARGIDEDYLLKEIPSAIDQTLQGIERVSSLVSAMKEFSRPGNAERVPVDLNGAIESTLAVARNEWKYVADLETDFDPSLPLVPCLPGELNQVILNLIVNAAHAIVDAVKEGGRGRITIRTKHEGGWAEVRVEDTGTGIPVEIRDRIFDPFFTTKEVGQGSGQGLAIAHSVIVDKHKGTIHFETEIGKGTAFTIRLPLEQG
jgi:signal transduction histidine kinase